MPVDAPSIHTNGKALGAAQLELPELPEISSSGTQLVLRAVSLTFLLLGSTLVAAVFVASIVEIDLTVEAQGTLEPITIWPVRSMESGIIGEVLVATGDTVRQGQILARLDTLSLHSTWIQLQEEYHTRLFAYQRAQASFRIKQGQQPILRKHAEAENIRAHAQLREQLTTYGFGGEVDSVLRKYTIGSHIAVDLALADVISSKADLQNADAQTALQELEMLDLKQQQMELEQLRTQIKTIEERLDRLTIMAPAEGVVLTEQVERLTGSLLQQGALLLELAEIHSWGVKLYVRQQDLHDVHVGDMAKIEIRAFHATSRELIYGRVTSLAAESSEDDGNVVPAGFYRITIALDEAEVDRLGRDQLRKGYFVEGKIITGSGRIMELLWRYLMDQINR